MKLKLKLLLPVLLLFLCAGAGTNKGDGYVYHTDFEGAVFRYDGVETDLAEFVDDPAKRIIDVRLVDNMAVIHGITRDNLNAYYYYLISDKVVEFCDHFDNLIWLNNDFETRVYSIGNKVYRKYDEFLGATRGNIVSMEYAPDGTSIICETEPFTFDFTHKMNGRQTEIINCHDPETYAAIDKESEYILDNIYEALPDEYTMNYVADDFDNDGEYEMFFVTWNMNDEITPSDIPKSYFSNDVRYCALRYYDDGRITVLPQNERFLFFRLLKKFTPEDGKLCVCIESYKGSNHWDADFYTVTDNTPHHMGTLANGYITGNTIYEGSLSDSLGNFSVKGGPRVYIDSHLTR